MFSHVLECPKCKNRFGFDSETGLPERISCPRCGESLPYSDFSALVLCPECRTKLKIPCDLLSDPDLACPQCGKPLRLGTGEWDPGTDSSGEELSSRFPVSRRMLQDGEFIDKYRIISLLGRGGMAEVYLGEHLLLHQKCALKLMRGGLGEKDPVYVKRFVREARLAHSIDHPNIVKVYDVGSDFKTCYLFIAMEYVEGRTLSDIVRERPMSEDELWKILYSMADALSALDRLHVVHRDIKPSNIMQRAGDGVYKLMDLGIAKSSGGIDGEVTLTMEQATIGTPSYASPEQCQSSHDTDIRSDIYCLGATMYHLASGKVPFDGGTPVEIILKVMREEPEPLETLRPDLSPRFIGLVRKMMQKDPADRPQTPAELLEYISGIKSAVSGDGAEPDKSGSRGIGIFKSFPGKKLFRFLLGAGLVVLIAVNVRFLYKEMKEDKETQEFSGPVKKTSGPRIPPMPPVRPSVPPYRPAPQPSAAPVPQKMPGPPVNQERPQTGSVPVPKKTPKLDPPREIPGFSRYLPRPLPVRSSEDGTIETRIGRAEKRLKELQQEIAASSKPEERDLLKQKIVVRSEQIRRLNEQLSVRELSKHVDRSRFNTDRMEKFKQKFAEHTRMRRDWGYNQRDIEFANWMLEELKSGEIDPDIEVVDSTYSTHSGPLLKSIMSGRIQQQELLAKQLIQLGADTSRVLESKVNYYNKAYAEVLIRGGYNALAEKLLPYMKRNPMQERIVTELLYLNHRIDEKDELGNTALHYAARSGSDKLVSLLILLDAEVNARNEQGETPLFEAMKSGRKNIYDMLLKAGADPEIKDNSGKTAADMEDIGRFQNAVNRCQVRVVEELLKKGVDPNVRFSNDQTALQAACRQKNRMLVKLLLDNGADPNIGSKNSVRTYYPLQIAFDLRTRDAEIFAMLVKKGANPNVPPIGYGGTTLLKHMCQGYHESKPWDEPILDALLDDPRTELYLRSWGREKPVSILLLAIRRRRPSWFVKKILGKFHSFEQWEPVVAEAVFSDCNDDVIKEMIDKGANVNIPVTRVEFVSEKSSAGNRGSRGARRRREYTATALYAAVEKGRLEVVKMLLKKGADPDWKSPGGKSIRELDASPQIKRLLGSFR